MKKKDQREWTKENYLHNGVKTQNQWTNNRLDTTIEKPGINESGKKIKKQGF